MNPKENEAPMNAPNVSHVTLRPLTPNVRWKCDVCEREFPTVTSGDGPRHLLRCNHDDTFSIPEEADERARTRESANKEGRAAGRKEVFESLAKVLATEAPDVLKDAYLDLAAEEYSHDSEPPPSPDTQPEDIGAATLS